MLYAKGEIDSFELFNGENSEYYDYMDDSAVPFVICNGEIYEGEGELNHLDIFIGLAGTDNWDDVSYLRKEMEAFDDFELGRLWVEPELSVLSFWGYCDKVDKQLTNIILDEYAVNHNNTVVVSFNWENETVAIPYNEWDGSLTKMDDNVKAKYAIHLMNAKDKNNATGDFRKTRDRLIGKKLTNDKGVEMPVAQYRSMVYAEGKKIENIIRNVLKEYIYKDRKIIIF